jgi:hypothetical protein
VFAGDQGANRLCGDVLTIDNMAFDILTDTLKAMADIWRRNSLAIGGILRPEALDLARQRPVIGSR